ncbi:phosphatidate cytidylyltransferase [Treponema ruminis]|uniref:Dolichol kinase n=1 Tax=Treponema ruminis TaxID=744515 RepID=A0A7W8G8E8_9SPIR|nr:diacylglycerol/polyprenol kinase family protein [Treponema ruminis]MBB5225778.1 dolichol kinase [Treponema ruminis]QSI02468.1 phosphatidate cytidylyltransferase [Treponema ruminis]
MKYFCYQIGIELKNQLTSLRKEFFRKTIHICTAFVPLFMHFARVPAILCLCAAGVLYIIAESLRSNGHEIPLVSDITAAAARKRDENKFVLGPVTLVAGIIAAALLWDEKAASVGILALAFGDGLASLAGKSFGKIHVPYTHGKTVEGSLTCFAAIFSSTFLVTDNCQMSLLVATLGALIEVLPLKDFDNLIIPIFLGGIVTYF